MAQIGVSCPRGLVEWPDCQVCALNPLHPCDYTPDILDQMRIDYSDPDREPGVESFTPTRILGCARQPVLMGESDYYVDVDGAWNLVRGNMVHALMEAARYPGAVAVVREQRMALEVPTKYGPQKFTAKPDLIVVKSIENLVGLYGDVQVAEDGSVVRGEYSIGIPRTVVHIKVVDYKSTGDIGHDMREVKTDHALQVNMYAWVAQQMILDFLPGSEHLDSLTEVVVDEVEVVYAAMKKVRRFTSAGSRLTKGKMLTRNPRTHELIELKPIPLWPMEKVGRFIAAKIEERIEAETQLPPILEGDDAWRCDYCAVRDVCYQIGNQP